MHKQVPGYYNAFDHHCASVPFRFVWLNVNARESSEVADSNQAYKPNRSDDIYYINLRNTCLQSSARGS